ncbi:Immediate early response 3-interacting protein 1 [Orchesella cincta]|uniref:Immediate early response 3-interacting protein 1 n=1 Tax=Orchesella cincta TaxID=48709 RepID=A0A1D2MZB5_ORCCI|nr:Immediate early response 3-interacting protein 1 [Orchesella cincta]
MAITLWNLFEATLLCLNAVCVLNEERFLSKFGFGLRNPNHLEGFGEQSQGTSTKAQILHLIRSIRTVVKYPLIAINVLIITVKLILG